MSSRERERLAKEALESYCKHKVNPLDGEEYSTLVNEYLSAKEARIAEELSRRKIERDQ